MITLDITALPPGQWDAADLLPEKLHGLDATTLATRPLAEGMPGPVLGDCARITIDGDDPILLIRGETHRLSGLGRNLDGGVLIIEGSAGPEAGAGMRGGELVIHANAGARLGAGMRGGLIRVYGDAGDWVGAALPGAVSGMRGGSILVQGSAGDRVADRMRRGLIVVAGDCGTGAASQMLAGTLVMLGKAGATLGSGMRRGSVLLCDESAIPDTGFAGNGLQTLGMIPLLRNYLESLDRKLAKALRPFSRVDRHLGDRGCGGLGELLLARGSSRRKS
jgi:formylmethanofuran dehydrogenase subunit C